MTDGPRITPPPGRLFFATAMDQVYGRFAAEALRERELDALVFEMVRLRCAQYHDCRLCQSRRLHDAVEAGMDEALVEKIARYESSDLPERIKVALRLTDCVIVDPAGADDALRSDLAKHFTDAQIAELLFDIVKWSMQKVLVSLRLEGAEAGLTSITIDEHGTMRDKDRLLEPSRL